MYRISYGSVVPSHTNLCIVPSVTRLTSLHLVMCDQRGRVTLITGRLIAMQCQLHELLLKF